MQIAGMFFQTRSKTSRKAEN
ncbi:hypothetical protein ACTNES_13610 [Blautia sp. HCP3S3_D9]